MEFNEKKTDRNLWNQNGIRIPLPMGVPEIGTKNQNSQPSLITINTIRITLTLITLA
jgi:hypothetical protein